MRTEQPSQQGDTHEAGEPSPGDTVAAVRPVPTVGPLGGIVFSGLCLGSYVAVVAALVVG